MLAFGKQDLERRRRRVAEGRRRWRRTVPRARRRARARRRSRRGTREQPGDADASSDSRSSSSRILLLMIARAFWRLVDGIIEACGGTHDAAEPQATPVKLVRDPVCGTYVAPRAVARHCAPAARRTTSARRSAATEVREGCVDEHPRRRADSRRHRRSRPPHVRARLRRLERRQHQRPARRHAADHHAEERVEGLHDPGHDGDRRLRGQEARRRSRRRRPSCRCTSRSTATGPTSTPWCTRIRRSPPASPSPAFR